MLVHRAAELVGHGATVELSPDGEEIEIKYGEFTRRYYTVEEFNAGAEMFLTFLDGDIVLHEMDDDDNEAANKDE